MSKNFWIPKYNYYSKRLSMWQEKLWREVNGKPFMGILDNIAGRKTFEYATFGRSGVQQANSKLMTITPQKINIQKMTACCVWNASNAIPSDSGLTTTINRGQRIYGTTGGTPMDPAYAYGYAGDANNWHSVTAFGSMAATTYNDGGGTSRTVRSMYDTEPGTPGGSDLYFSLDGASISNSDTTWLDITWDNISGTPITWTRSTEATYTASLNSDTHWRDLTPSSDWTDIDSGTDFVLTTS
jgi:hypothetical protein